ncbi:hypothetical protein Goklo_010770, partial [Gossypium klotzschianum]|nr:hypothetical protein [Gossypium klotzschianum]
MFFPRTLSRDISQHVQPHFGYQFPFIFVVPSELPQQCLQLDGDLAPFKECRLLQTSHQDKERSRFY